MSKEDATKSAYAWNLPVISVIAWKKSGNNLQQQPSPKSCLWINTNILSMNILIAAIFPFTRILIIIIFSLQEYVTAVYNYRLSINTIMLELHCKVRSISNLFKNVFGINQSKGGHKQKKMLNSWFSHLSTFANASVTGLTRTCT